MLLLIDTNFYIDAIRDVSFGAQFRVWHRKLAPTLGLSAVVLHELLVGAQHDVHLQHRIEVDYAMPFRNNGRLIAPSVRVWERAAAADATFRAKRHNTSRLAQRGFFNDLLIALTAREIGATVLTKNRDDFDLIRSVTGVRHRAVLPQFGEDPLS